jgi:hypothetical protein
VQVRRRAAAAGGPRRRPLDERRIAIHSDDLGREPRDLERQFAVAAAEVEDAHARRHEPAQGLCPRGPRAPGDERRLRGAVRGLRLVLAARAGDVGETGDVAVRVLRGAETRDEARPRTALAARLGRQRVEDEAPLLPLGHEPRVAQQRQVPRHRGLPAGDDLRQLPRRQLLLRHEAQETQAGGVAEEPEGGGQHFHIDISAYVDMEPKISPGAVRGACGTPR